MFLSPWVFTIIWWKRGTSKNLNISIIKLKFFCRLQAYLDVKSLPDLIMGPYLQLETCDLHICILPKVNVYLHVYIYYYFKIINRYTLGTWLQVLFCDFILTCDLITGICINLWIDFRDINVYTDVQVWTSVTAPPWGPRPMRWWVGGSRRSRRTWRDWTEATPPVGGPSSCLWGWGRQVKPGKSYTSINVLHSVIMTV